jgi:hypothetical protein
MKKHLLPSFVALLLISAMACKKSSSSGGGTGGGTGGGGTGGTSVGLNNGTYSGNKLVVSTALGASTSWLELGFDTVFTEVVIPSGLFKNLPTVVDNKIVSFYLPKGYMVVFAANGDGSGESGTFIAIDNAVKANLPVRLRNNISYVRCIKVNNPDKKGTASTTETTVRALGSQWYYGWSIDKNSWTNEQFVPMTWGKGTATDAQMAYLVGRNDVDHLLSFNEPDNSSQSNVPVDTAIARYRLMVRSGLRLGSPACKEENAFGAGKWLTNFMAQATSANMRVDYVAIHWYDWGNPTASGANDSLTAVGAFNRFRTYVQNVRTAYPTKPIWITEYNANVGRSSVAVQKHFMKMSSEWLNTVDYVERYSFFFETNYSAVSSPGVLSDIGNYWRGLPSTKSFSGNVIGDCTIVP